MFFSTIFDKNYISRANLMINSLEITASNDIDKIFIFSLDNHVTNFFKNKGKIEIINIEAIETEFPELQMARNNRNYVEYIFTLSPFMPLYIFKKYSYVKRITTIDADLFFFDNPKYIIENLQENSIGITKHDFDFNHQHMNIYGKFNVSFQSFPNSKLSIDCLNNWALNCIEFCSDYLDSKGRFADQKYLDDWITHYDNISIFETPNIGLAPWNIKKFDIRFKNNILYCNNIIPIFYHFHHLRIKNKYHLIFADFGTSKISRDIKRLYFWYWDQLNSSYEVKFDNIKRNTLTKFNLRKYISEFINYPHLFKFKSYELFLDFRKYFNLFK